jgi:hypothetical protein
MATFEELTARKAALRELPGWRVAHSEPPRVLELWAVDNRENFDLFLEEVIRLLHNFVAAARSLRDHSLRVKRKLLPRSNTDRLAEEYEARSVSTFDEPLPRFVQDLRHYVLHVRLPIPSGHASGRRVGDPDRAPAEFEFESRIVLHPSDLLEWQEWKSASRAFIDSAGDHISIEEVVSEYAALVKVFQSWFRGALSRRHREPLAELERQDAEIRRRFQEFSESADLG